MTLSKNCRGTPHRLHSIGADLTRLVPQWCGSGKRILPGLMGLRAGAKLDHDEFACRALQLQLFIPVTDPRLLDEIGTRLSEILAQSPAADIEKNARALLAAFFDRFDLVTRDDFEVQKRVLERALARIAELERHLGEIEAREANDRPPG